MQKLKSKPKPRPKPKSKSKPIPTPKPKPKAPVPDPGRIIEIIRANSDHPMKIKELARVTRIKPRHYPLFRQAIKKLIEAGELVKLKRGRIGFPEKMDLITGTISITRAGFGFLACDKSDEEVFIAARDLFTAFDGDRVMVRLKAGYGFKGKREGVVLDIIERKRDQLVGIFRKGRGYNYVRPDVKNFQRDIDIVRGKFAGASDGEKVVVKIENWGDQDLHPEGSIVKRLGYPGDPGVDTLSIINNYNIPVEFPDEVMNEAGFAADNWAGEMKKRRDLCGLTLFTIDPIDARDFDDAVSLEMIDGNYRLGVHIADVSHFVQSNSLLDSEALLRGTSVYFPDRVVPMLPEVLANDVCSLRPNRKRLAYTIFIDYDVHGDVLDYQLFPSVIRSRARLSYEEVQQFFDGQKVNERTARVTNELTQMQKLARLLLKRRNEAGSLDFDLPEAKITIDKKGNVTDIGNRVRTESHRLVEEFMLAANRQVALHFFRNALPSLYRVHERPDMEKLEAFSSLMNGFGFHFPVSPQMPAQDFTRFIKKIKGRPEEELINELLLRSMKKAVYQPKNIGHFGLAFSHYLHFTSPIRRYPDLFIHRLLKQIENNRYPVKLAGKLPSLLVNVGTKSSEAERRAVKAEREATKALQVYYMSKHVGGEYDGIISGVTNFGIFVRLVEPGCEGLVRVSTLDDDYYRYDEAGFRMVGRRHHKVFQLADKIRVGILRVDVEARVIELFVVNSRTSGVKPKGRRALRTRKK